MAKAVHPSASFTCSIQLHATLVWSHQIHNHLGLGFNSPWCKFRNFQNQLLVILPDTCSWSMLTWRVLWRNQQVGDESLHRVSVANIPAVLLAVSSRMFGEFYAISFQLLECFLKEDAKKHPRLQGTVCKKWLLEWLPGYLTKQKWWCHGNRWFIDVIRLRLFVHLPLAVTADVGWEDLSWTSNDFNFNAAEAAFIWILCVPHPGCEKL